jgi:hypothetical protein
VAQVRGKSSVSGDTLHESTQSLIESLQKENERMEIDGGPTEISVDGLPGLSTYLHNDSPAGGTEKDWVVTVIGPEGLYYYVFVAPESDYARFKPAFEGILESIQYQK